ncbi:hypothetical protein [Novipirellula artificiosorum]|uniref:Uncharacterized protein n=1 Tax=Novipirellula artificiosorum TaxID=2528016 RepID=A0A5C6DDH6_9BACT|nr:hypothetical protein [Novipirellula artificiosorum]TWU33934.1 hypothetical protein Poly41_49340 [Novipirellula artificiosorum]
MNRPMPGEDEIFRIARAIADPDARAEYLKSSCGDDTPLHERVQAMLKIELENDSFLEGLPPGLTATSALPLSEESGDTIGHYKLLQKIGSGTNKRKWLPGDHAISTTLESIEQGAKIKSSAISGWDAKRNQLVERWYSSDGLSSTIRYPLDQIKAKTWKGNFTVTFGDGTEFDGDCLLEKNDDGFIWTAKFMKDGKEQVRKSIARRIR